ncbi:MAG: Hsp20/alpha crystallin family protein [Acidimicrobiia bacterium]|nr:Hsp20/alpha crystallin family protein [Acidimicrobiia bacterium]
MFQSLIPFEWGGSSLPSKRRGHDPFSRLHEEVEKVFENFGRLAPMRWPGNGEMADFKIDMSETDKELRITAELPGVDEKDVEVTLHGDLLTIKCEKKVEEERKKENYHVVERSYGAFERTFRLPYEVGEKDVSAEFDKSVLKVVLPKPAEVRSETKKISVKAKK